MTVRTKIRDIAYGRFPYLYNIWAKGNGFLGREVTPIYVLPFSGWGMTTASVPPWYEGKRDKIASDFFITHQALVSRIKSGAMNLSQFKNEMGDDADIPRVMSGLMWRHYIVFWSATFAAKVPHDDKFNIVECGVADGLTSYFAMNALISQNISSFQCFLYDSWEGMREESLTTEEKSNKGRYSYLSVANTKNNLIEFKDNLTFNIGFIPESLSTSTSPEKIAWLHIDLNSSAPTTAALEFFYDRLIGNGLVLFDDYAGYADTKKVIDAFFRNKSGILLPLPTGQAIYFNF